MAGCMFAFGSSFIALWLGEEYVGGGFFERSDVIMWLLLAAHAPRVLQSISWQLLFATRKQGFLAKLNGAEAVANLGLSLVLVRYLGIVGVALGTVIPLVVTHVLFLPRYIASHFGIPVRRYLLRGIGSPVLVGVVVYGVGAILTDLVPPRDWGTFAWEAAITVGVGAALLYSFVLDAAARAQVRGILGRVTRRSA